MPDIIREWPWAQSDRLIYAWPDGETPLPPPCANCGPGLGQMFAWRIKSGPTLSPIGKAHWMDLAGPNGENRSGWYDCELLHADCPACRSGKRGEYLENNSGMEGSQLQVNFTLFNDKPEKQPAVSAVKKIISEQSGWLTLHGDFGTGKTSMLFAACNATIKAGNPAYYITAANLLADIRRRFSDGNKMSTAVEDAIANWIGLPFLCIDEIDRVSITQWTQETLFRILDARYQAAASRATLLVTNTNPDTIGKEFAYLASRMHAGKIVKIAGADMRKATR
jgi:DNA replication protein DnaC